MADNLFIRLTAKLNRAASKTNIEKDVKQLERTPFYLNLLARLNKNQSRRQIQNDVRQVSRNQHITLNANVNRQSLQNSLRTARRQAENNARSNPIQIHTEVNTDNLNEARQAQGEIINQNSGLRNLVQSYINWNRVIDLVIQAVRKAVGTVKELAKAQTDLQIVTSKTESEMRRLMKNYNTLAKDLSSTTADVTNAADEWLRTGKTISETEELVADSAILAKIGQLESTEATQYLTSAMNGFKLEASDAISIVDKLSATDLVSATSAGGLAEALSKCSNSAAVAGVNMDTLIGYIATVKEVTQKTDSVVGESFKTIFARMGRIKLGEFIDEDGTDISGQINDIEKTLGKFDIALRKNSTEFRNFEDVIYDVGMAWKNFSSLEQNAIANAFGGTYQRENVFALFENFDRAMELSKVSADSAGTAMKKFEIYENSLEAATNRLTASFESLAYNTVNEDFLAGLAQSSAEIVEFVDSTKLIQTGLTALAFTGVIKGVLMLGSKMVIAKNNLVNMSAAMRLSLATTQRSTAENAMLAGSYTKLSAAQQRLILSNKKLTAEQRIGILTATGLSRAEAVAQLETMGLVTAEGAAATATFSLRGAWEALKLSIASNPIGLIVTALTTAAMAVSHITEQQREATKAADEAADAARDEQNAISDLYNEYKTISKEYETDVTKKNALIDVTDNLLEKLGYEKSMVSDLIEKYGDLNKAIDSITLDQIRDAQNKFLTDYNIKKDALLGEDWLSGYNMGITVSAKDKGLGYYDDMIDLLNENLLFRNDKAILSGLADNKILYPTADSPTFALTLHGDVNTVEGVYQNYQEIGKAIELLKNNFSWEEIGDNNLYKDLNKYYEQYKTRLDEYNQAVTDVNTSVAKEQVLTHKIEQGLPQTADEYKQFEDNLISLAQTNEMWTDKYVGTTDDVEEAIRSVLSEMPEFAEFFNITKEQTKSAIPTVQSLTGAYEELAEKIEDVLKKQKDLAEAYKKVVSGEVYTPTEAFELLSQYPELYEYMSKVDGGFTFSAEGIKAAFEKQNNDLIKEINSKIAEQEKGISYYQDKLYELGKLASGQYDVNSSPVYNKYQGEIDKYQTTINGLNALLEILSDNTMDEHALNIEGIKTRFEDNRDAAKDYNDQIKSVISASQKLAEGEALTYDEKVALVEIAPELKDSFDKTANGYTIEAKLLEELKTKTKETRDVYIQSQIDETSVLARQVGLRIGMYKTELNALIPYINSLDEALKWSGLLNAIAESEEELKLYNEQIVVWEAMLGDIYDDDKNSSSSSKTNDILQNQIDYYQMLLDAIQIVADKRIEALEAEKDALKEKNDEEQRELDLIEAKNNLDKARKQKVVVYEEDKGLVQVQDKKVIADAEKELKDAENAIKEAEIDKKIQDIEDYSKQYSEMGNNIQDTLTVEQAKKALDTDENGLMNLSQDTTKQISEGMAEAVLAKDIEENSGNPYYKEVTLDDLLKSFGANVTAAQFWEQSSKWTYPTINPLYKEYKEITENNVTNTTSNNTKTVTLAPVINITESNNPQATATAVRNELGKFLTEFNNRIK